MHRKKKRPLKDYLLAAGLVLLLLWLLWLLVDIVRKEEIARGAAADAKEELRHLEERRTTLTQNLDELDTSRGQEASYREHFGVARPGEEVIIVVAQEVEAPQSGLSWWRKLLGWFGL